MPRRKDNNTQRPAEDALDQRVFFLDAKAHEEFLALLDAPPKPNAALKKLVARTPAWQR